VFRRPKKPPQQSVPTLVRRPWWTVRHRTVLQGCGGNDTWLFQGMTLALRHNPLPGANEGYGVTDRSGQLQSVATSPAARSA